MFVVQRFHQHSIKPTNMHAQTLYLKLSLSGFLSNTPDVLLSSHTPAFQPELAFSCFFLNSELTKCSTALTLAFVQGCSLLQYV